jgi:hypothetical protein
MDVSGSLNYFNAIEVERESAAKRDRWDLGMKCSGAFGFGSFFAIIIEGSHSTSAEVSNITSGAALLGVVATGLTCTVAGIYTARHDKVSAQLESFETTAINLLNGGAQSEELSWINDSTDIPTEDLE